MAAVTLALVGFFSFLIVHMTTPEMVPLYTDLSLNDSASILKELDSKGIDYQLRNGGSVVMVPRAKVARLRMTLAEDGLPKGDGVGYEIFDKSDTLGATNFVQHINRLRALEGELSRTIRSLDQVEAARVHLVLPQRQLFSRDKAEPTASIVLKVRGTLRAGQVRAIRHLVASAVNGLKPERISVVDESGQLLADGSGDNSAMSAQGAEERKVAYEERLRKQVKSIVDSVVGPGHARVQIAADFDLNRITETSNNYNPDGRVIRSSQSREETDTSGNHTKVGGAVSVSAQLPGNGSSDQGTTSGDTHPQDRGSGQLRDLAHYQDRDHRAGPSQARFGRGAGRRRLHQGRQRQDGLQAALPAGDQPHHGPGALGHRLRQQARRPGRGGQPAIRPAGADPARPAHRPARQAELHQERPHARRRPRGDGIARPLGAVDGGAATGPPHHHARTGPPRPAARASPARSASARTAARTPAARRFRSSAARRRSRSPTVPRR